MVKSFQRTLKFEIDGATRHMERELKLQFSWSVLDHTISDHMESKMISEFVVPLGWPFERDMIFDNLGIILGSIDEAA